MASWSAIEAQAPELCSQAKAFFDVFTHKTLATLRRDGSPRISGTEVLFTEGELWLGSMWRAMKALDPVANRPTTSSSSPGTRAAA